MSVHEGKKIAASIDVFNEKASAESQKQLSNLMKTVRHRDFGDMHFQTFRKIMDGVRNATPIKILDQISYNDKSPLKDRAFSMMLAYMGLSKTVEEHMDPDDYVPVLMKAGMTPKDMYLTNRPVPIILSSQHTEFRFVQRTSARLNYDSDDFRWTMVTALLLTLSIPETIIANKGGPIPVVLPHAGGFYLGHGFRCGKTDFYPAEYMVASRSGPDGKPFSYNSHDQGSPLPPSWTSETCLRLLTFVAKRDLFHDQIKLMKLFTDVFSDPRCVKAYNAFMFSYTTPTISTTEEILDMNWAIAKFRQIVSSPEFKAVQAHGVKHAMRMEWN